MNLFINHGADEIGLALAGPKSIIFDQRPCQDKRYYYGLPTHLIAIKTAMMTQDRVVHIINPTNNNMIELWSTYIDGTFHLLNLAKELGKPVTIILNLTREHRWLRKQLKPLIKLFCPKVIKYTGGEILL